MTYMWKSDVTGTVTIKPRQMRDPGTGIGRVSVVYNGDISPIFTVINFGH